MFNLFCIGIGTVYESLISWEQTHGQVNVMVHGMVDHGDQGWIGGAKGKSFHDIQ